MHQRSTANDPAPNPIQKLAIETNTWLLNTPYVLSRSRGAVSLSHTHHNPIPLSRNVRLNPSLLAQVIRVNVRIWEGRNYEEVHRVLQKLVKLWDANSHTKPWEGTRERWGHTDINKWHPCKCQVVPSCAKQCQSFQWQQNNMSKYSNSILKRSLLETTVR